jgi:hypothetical protein
MSQAFCYQPPPNSPGILDWRPSVSESTVARQSFVEVERHFRSPATRATSTLENLFDQLVVEWLADTLFSSSTTQMVMHPSYQRIIGLGERAVPLIIRRLRAGAEHWGWALEAITGESPVVPEDAGRIDRIRDAWLRWADQHGL